MKMCSLQNIFLYKNCKEIEIKPNLTKYIREGVIIFQAINDFSDKYMVPVDLESFKTPNLTPHTLLNSKLNIYFVLFENSNSNFEHLLKKKGLTSTVQ